MLSCSSSSRMISDLAPITGLPVLEPVWSTAGSAVKTCSSRAGSDTITKFVPGSRRDHKSPWRLRAASIILAGRRWNLTALNSRGPRGPGGSVVGTLLAGDTIEGRPRRASRVPLRPRAVYNRLGLRLAIIEGNDAGREIPLEGEVVVGRSPDADVVVSDEEVSTRHASFVESDGVASVEDLGSTNGTLVNGERLTERRELAEGDRVRLGATVLEVRGDAPATSVAQIAVAKPTRVKEIPTLPVLVFVSGQEAGTEVPVSGQVVVGRDPGAADVVLDQDSEVSRR